MGMSTIKHSTFLKHHRLRVWHKSVDLVRYVNANPIKQAELRNQAMRAATSIALNIAEGAGLSGANSKRHFTIARGSAVEVAAAYELAQALGEKHSLDELLELTTTVAAMLSGLGR